MPKINTSINITVSEEVYKAYKNSTVKQEFIREALENRIYFEKRFNELMEVINNLTVNGFVESTDNSLKEKEEIEEEIKKEVEELDENTVNTLNSFMNFSLGGEDN